MPHAGWRDTCPWFSVGKERQTQQRERAGIGCGRCKRSGGDGGGGRDAPTRAPRSVTPIEVVAHTSEALRRTSSQLSSLDGRWPVVLVGGAAIIRTIRLLHVLWARGAARGSPAGQQCSAAAIAAGSLLQRAASLPCTGLQARPISMQLPIGARKGSPFRIGRPPDGRRPGPGPSPEREQTELPNAPAFTPGMHYCCQCML